ncbi:hypothetical protein NP493_735g03024 [Ridgeia piscesae]|uniref:CCHC-type domain-containing protein n=1 Tax=Ridgeia piscesae TaxID=27915 RepID=A0AAD9NNX5_RIDPI|nr:hypothetical protein NP493_735g03024 [Ridgeia piscesae]
MSRLPIKRLFSEDDLKRWGLSKSTARLLSLLVVFKDKDLEGRCEQDVTASWTFCLKLLKTCGDSPRTLGVCAVNDMSTYCLILDVLCLHPQWHDVSNLDIQKILSTRNHLMSHWKERDGGMTHGIVDGAALLDPNYLLFQDLEGRCEQDVTTSWTFCLKLLMTCDDSPRTLDACAVNDVSTCCLVLDVQVAFDDEVLVRATYPSSQTTTTKEVKCQEPVGSGKTTHAEKIDQILQRVTRLEQRTDRERLTPPGYSQFKRYSRSPNKYPSPDRMQSPGRGQSPSFSGRCYNCGETGHMSRHCSRSRSRSPSAVSGNDNIPLKE